MRIAQSIRGRSACMAITMSSAVAQDPTVSTADRRENISDLPAGAQPWWPIRYRANDQLGTLNEITAATVRAAASVVKQGRVIDLGRTLDENIPKFPGPYWHQSVDVSPHYTNLRRADTVGKGWGKNAINWITEIQAGTFQVGTQLDSIGERLPRGEVITRADLEGALKRQGKALQPGDAVLIHTGWGVSWGRDNEEFLWVSPALAWRPSAGSMHSASVSPVPIPGVTAAGRHHPRFPQGDRPRRLQEPGTVAR